MCMCVWALGVCVYMYVCMYIIYIYSIYIYVYIYINATDQLDQHLEGLQAAGVHDIVRVGNNSKSTKLADRNLRALVRLDLQSIC